MGFQMEAWTAAAAGDQARVKVTPDAAGPWARAIVIIIGYDDHFRLGLALG